MPSDDNDKSFITEVLNYLTKHFGPDMKKFNQKKLNKSTPATPESNKKLFPDGMPPRQDLPSNVPPRKPKKNKKPKAKPSESITLYKGGFTRKGPCK